MVPSVVVAAGMILSVVAWRALSSYEEGSLRNTLETASSELARAIEARLQREISELKDLGLTWSELGTSDVKRWEAEARLFVKCSDELLTIEWDPLAPRADGPLAYATTEGLELVAVLRANEALERDRRTALESGVETLLGPFPTPVGPVLELFVPIHHGKSSIMILTARMRATALLDEILAHRAPECALSVRDARGGVLYQRGGSPAEVAPERIASEVIRVHPSTQWTLAVRPSQALLGSLHLRLPKIVLGAGAILSILIAAMIRMELVSLSGWHRLLEKSTELEGRNREIERVDRRSHDLSERNVALRQERRALSDEIASLKAQMAATHKQDGHDSAVAELEAFTYSVSHDLRSPMGAILNYSAVLAEDYHDLLGDEGGDSLSRISSSARTAIAMMDGLLAFSRIGRQELKLAPVDVGNLVREVYQELREALPHAPPELSIGELPAVQGDPALLRVLFTNLLSNAFKFTRDVASPRIDVGGYVRGSDTVYYVEDNGVGFDMQHAHKLFGVFERLHRADEYEGHGVGLAIVERIVRRHGGTVRAEGALAKGATFFVTLPQEPTAAVHHGRIET